ncbi:MAG: class I SAM-dependent methyltransferase [Gemmatimonadetes bacterium]|nr:class I SAM-dependent methyltransferase [Gemmatimonadota bacterium]
MIREFVSGGSAAVRAFLRPPRGRSAEAGEPEPPRRGDVDFGGLRRLTPISRHWGFDRGLPVDRHYIESFLRRHAHDIRGSVLEAGDSAYTRRFGGRRVTESDVLHRTPGAEGATIIADLTSAEHVPSDRYDCIVLTQTLQFVYDVPAAMRTLHRILKPHGVLLLTVPGITQTTHDEWRSSWYWSFTLIALARIAGEAFPPASFTVQSHGNVLAAIAFLHGIAASELHRDELRAHDPDYPVTLTLRARKSAPVEHA